MKNNLIKKYIFYIAILVLVLSIFFLYLRNDTKEKYEDKPEITLGILAMFKNEAMVLEEWIQHYIWQGADLIVLLNNNSTDNFKEITDKYKNIVHVIDYPKNHAQVEGTRDVGIPYLKERNIDVVAIVDVDEYFFGTDGKKFKEYVVNVFGKEKDRPSQFSCHWHMFGSSGYDKQPESIRKSFLWKEKEMDKDNVKSVTWINNIIPGNKDHWPFYHKTNVSGNTISCPAGLQLNHYAIMSKEYFEKIKMTRGDAAVTNNVRDLNYFFNRIKTPLVEDMTLANLLEKN